MRRKEQAVGEVGRDEATRNLVNAVVGVVERDGRASEGEIRYLDRGHGAWVSVDFDGRESSKTSKLLVFDRLKRGRARRRRFKEGVSVLVVESSKISQEGDEDLIGGVLINWEKDDGNSHINTVDIYPVQRVMGRYPNFQHVIPLGGPARFKPEELAHFADIINGLKPENVISDPESSRSDQEILQDRLLAAMFVQWVDRSYNSARNVANRSGRTNLPNYESIEWLNEGAGLSTMTFIPDHFENHAVLLVQEQREDGWEVREYVVDKTENNKRIYKAVLKRPLVVLPSEQGSITVPPFPHGEEIAPFVAKDITKTNDKDLVMVFNGGNRASGEELTALMDLAESITSEHDPEKSSEQK